MSIYPYIRKMDHNSHSSSYQVHCSISPIGHQFREYSDLWLSNNENGRRKTNCAKKDIKSTKVRGGKRHRVNTKNLGIEICCQTTCIACACVCVCVLYVRAHMNALNTIQNNNWNSVCIVCTLNSVNRAYVRLKKQTNTHIASKKNSWMSCMRERERERVGKCVNWIEKSKINYHNIPLQRNVGSPAYCVLYPGDLSPGNKYGHRSSTVWQIFRHGLIRFRCCCCFGPLVFRFDLGV